MAIIKADTYKFNDTLRIPDGDTNSSLYGDTGATSITFTNNDGSLQYEAIKFLDMTSALGSNYCLLFKVTNGNSITVYDFVDSTWHWGLAGERYIIIDTDQEVSDDFSTWFSANTELHSSGGGETPEEPETPVIPEYPEIPTADSVKAKIQYLIGKSNEKTNKGHLDLTKAVNELITGYGSGGASGVPITIESQEELEALLANVTPDMVGKIYTLDGALFTIVEDTE
jgi:hypothetical protein